MVTFQQNLIHCSLRETDAFMSPAQVGCSRNNVQNEKEVLDAVTVKPTS
jgi:hypothetical protein